MDHKGYWHVGIASTLLLVYKETYFVVLECFKCYMQRIQFKVHNKWFSYVAFLWLVRHFYLKKRDVGMGLDHKNYEILNYKLNLNNILMQPCISVTY